MKKKRKNTNGYVLGVVILVLMFLSYSGSNEAALYKAGYKNVELFAMFLALINVIFNIIIAGLIPTILYLSNRKFYLKRTKLIYILNCILTIVISIPLFEAISGTESAGMGIIGSILFSNVVYNILKENYKRKSKFKDAVENKVVNKFKCSNCGTIVNDYDNKCPKCGAIFGDDEEIEQFKCDNCGAMVNIDAIECPNCGEEFNSDKHGKFNYDDIYNNALNYKNSGNIHQVESEFSKYITLVEKDIKNSKENVYSFNNCVEFIISSKQDKLGANAIDYKCSISNAYMNLAFIKFEQNMHDDSINLINKALKYNPCNIPALYELAENYKINNDLKKYYDLTNNIYDKIYNIHDLAHYYRNLGFYYIEKENWDLSKALYLYSLKYENTKIVLTEITYIIEKTNDKYLPSKENLTKILRENEIPLFIKKENLNIIKKLKSKMDEEGNSDSSIGKFINDLTNLNTNMF